MRVRRTRGKKKNNQGKMSEGLAGTLWQKGRKMFKCRVGTESQWKEDNGEEQNQVALRALVG